MKNILIISKIKLFEKEISKTRYKFLNFLNTKSNIEVIEDLPITIDESLKYLKKSIDFTPDIIMYYNLTMGNKWEDINIKDMDKTKIITCLFFEDFYYIQSIFRLFDKHKFDRLLIPSVNNIDYIRFLKKNNIDCNVWGIFIDTDEFNYDRELKKESEKEYDIVFYGYHDPKFYPLRNKIYRCLKYIQQKYPLSKIKIIEHPGYRDYSFNIPCGRELSILLNKSKFAISTSSYKNLFLKKYIEIPLSGCYLVGDIPKKYKELLNNNILEIKQEEEINIILKKLVDIVNGEYDILLKKEKMDNFANKLKETYNFEKGYEKLCKLFD